MWTRNLPSRSFCCRMTRWTHLVPAVRAAPEQIWKRTSRGNLRPLLRRGPDPRVEDARPSELSSRDVVFETFSSSSGSFSNFGPLFSYSCKLLFSFLLPHSLSSSVIYHFHFSFICLSCLRIFPILFWVNPLDIVSSHLSLVENVPCESHFTSWSSRSRSLTPYFLSGLSIRFLANPSDI